MVFTGLLKLLAACSCSWYAMGWILKPYSLTTRGNGPRQTHSCPTSAPNGTQRGTWETSEGDGGEGDPKMDPNLPQNGTPKGTWDQHCGMGEQDPKIDPNLPHICPKWDPRGTWDQQWGMGE